MLKTILKKFALRILRWADPLEAPNSDKEKFETWFKEPLQELYGRKHSGFTIMLAAIPILERYTRERSLTPETQGGLNAQGYQLIQSWFGFTTEQIAQEFWHVFRNGLVHQAAFSQARGGNPMPKAEITSQVACVSFQAATNRFQV